MDTIDIMDNIDSRTRMPIGKDYSFNKAKTEMIQTKDTVEDVSFVKSFQRTL